MQLHTQEHDDLMKMFEKIYNYKNPLKEDKQNWSKGFVYGNGQINSEFIAFRKGYAYGRSVYMNQH